MTENDLPEGWTEERVREVIAHYENQTEDEELAELEAAWNDRDAPMIQVPRELVPAVLALIAHYESLKRELPTSGSSDRRSRGRPRHHRSTTSLVKRVPRTRKESR